MKYQGQTSFGPIPLKKSVFYQKQRNNTLDFEQNLLEGQKLVRAERISHAMRETLHG